MMRAIAYKTKICTGVRGLLLLLLYYYADIAVISAILVSELKRKPIIFIVLLDFD
jgi:hypothetical protein